MPLVPILHGALREEEQRTLHSRIMCDEKGKRDQHGNEGEVPR